MTKEQNAATTRRGGNRSLIRNRLHTRSADVLVLRGMQRKQRSMGKNISSLDAWQKHSKTEGNKGPRQDLLALPSGDKETAITRPMRHIQHSNTTERAANPSASRALYVVFSLRRENICIYILRRGKGNTSPIFPPALRPFFSLVAFPDQKHRHRTAENVCAVCSAREVSSEATIFTLAKPNFSC